MYGVPKPSFFRSILAYCHGYILKARSIEFFQKLLHCDHSNNIVHVRCLNLESAKVIASCPLIALLVLLFKSSAENHESGVNQLG